MNNVKIGIHLDVWEDCFFTLVEVKFQPRKDSQIKESNLPIRHKVSLRNTLSVQFHQKTVSLFVLFLTNVNVNLRIRNRDLLTISIISQSSMDGFRSSSHAIGDNY